jgi:probable phosphoglycerate mutase
MIIYLVRHGQSESNVKKLVTGNKSDDLTSHGIKKVKKLAEWIKFSDIRPDRYVVSDWNRAQKTAQFIFHDAVWEIDWRIGETNAGDVASIKLEDFLNAYPEFYFDPSNQYPQGESHLTLNNRTLNWLNDQLKNPCECLFAVMHSGPISCIIQHVCNVPMTYFPTFLPQNASISVLEFKKIDHFWIGSLKGFSLTPDSIFGAGISAND